MGLQSGSLDIQRSELSQKVAHVLNKPVAEVDLIISVFLEKLANELGSGRSVSFLSDDLGRLEVIDGKARRVRNPHDQGAFINIPPQYRVRFRPSKKLNDQLKRSSKGVL